MDQEDGCVFFLLAPFLLPQQRFGLLSGGLHVQEMHTTASWGCASWRLIIWNGENRTLAEGAKRCLGSINFFHIGVTKMLVKFLFTGVVLISLMAPKDYIVISLYEFLLTLCYMHGQQLLILGITMCENFGAYLWNVHNLAISIYIVLAPVYVTQECTTHVTRNSHAHTDDIHTCGLRFL